jgi:hypothetical protein
MPQPKEQINYEFASYKDIDKQAQAMGQKSAKLRKGRNIDLFKGLDVEIKGSMYKLDRREKIQYYKMLKGKEGFMKDIAEDLFLIWLKEKPQPKKFQIQCKPLDITE